MINRSTFALRGIVLCSAIVLTSQALADETSPSSANMAFPASELSRAVVQKDNMQPAIPRPEQDKVADEKLDALYKKSGKRPNILWLVVDDLGFGDVGGPWGGGAQIGAATPQMDRIAANGLALTSTYSQPTCTPTRSAMMIGRLPVRTGLIRPILAGDKVTKNPWADEHSVAELLSDSGYHTVLTGKWHTGELEGMRPWEVGFDEFQGYYASQKELTQQFDGGRYPDLVYDSEKLGRFKKLGGKIDMYYGAKGKGEKVVEKTTSVEQFSEADQTLANFTIERIQALAKTDQPFFIAHNFMRVHADNHASKKFRGSSASKYPFKDNVVEVDTLVGRIVDSLDKAGVLENTFIFITSDNGPQMDSWPDSGTTPFRGGKGSSWEGGVRVPGIAYWKGMIKPRESAGIFDLMDLFNTSLNLAGASDKLLDDRYYDGIDQASFLLTDNGESKREVEYIWTGASLAAIRIREYKMHLRATEEQATHMGIDYSTTVQTGLSPWLFNLFIDSKESMPLGHRLNPWLASLVSEAKAHAATFKKYPPKKIGLE
ncbi:arylsulfatase [Pseudomonas sp. MS19]|nr:arylsulfatase [Pseudomonas sp. MS19]